MGVCVNMVINRTCDRKGNAFRQVFLSGAKRVIEWSFGKLSRSVGKWWIQRADIWVCQELRDLDINLEIFNKSTEKWQERLQCIMQNTQNKTLKHLGTEWNYRGDKLDRCLNCAKAWLTCRDRVRFRSIFRPKYSTESWWFGCSHYLIMDCRRR